MTQQPPSAASMVEYSAGRVVPEREAAVSFCGGRALPARTVWLLARTRRSFTTRQLALSYPLFAYSTVA